MASTLFQVSFVTRRCGLLLRAALLVTIVQGVCFGQAENLPPIAEKPGAAKTPADERAELLKLIKSLQERVEKLEAAQPAGTVTPVTPGATPETSPAL